MAACMDHFESSVGGTKVKREIVCPKCIDNWKRRRGINLNASALEAVLATQERIHIYKGTARTTYSCDDCGAMIDVATPCYAVSVSDTEHPYFPWESAFLALPLTEKGGEE